MLIASNSNQQQHHQDAAAWDAHCTGVGCDGFVAETVRSGWVKRDRVCAHAQSKVVRLTEETTEDGLVLEKIRNHFGVTSCVVA